MGFNCDDYAGQVVLFLFALNVPLVEFTIMLWVIIFYAYKSLTNQLCSRWNRALLQYAMIAGQIKSCPVLE